MWSRCGHCRLVSGDCSPAGDGVVESPINHVVSSVLGSDDEKIVTVRTDEEGYKSHP